MCSKSVFHLIYFLFLFSIVSCKSDLNEIDKSSKSFSVNNSAIKVVNGRLHFPNKTIFIETLKSVADKSTEDLNQWELQLGFSSLRQKISLSEDTIYNNIHYDLVKILNSRGEYQINDTIYWFANDKEEYIVLNKDENTLKELQASSKNIMNNNNIIKHNVSVKAIPISSIPKNARWIGGGNGAEQRTREFTGGNGGKYRFVFEAHQYEYSTHEVLGVQITMDYWKKNSICCGGKWLQAGETAIKEIAYLRASFCLPTDYNCNIYAQNVNYSGGYKYSFNNQPLNIAIAYNNSPSSGNIEVNFIEGDFLAESNHYGKLERWFENAYRW